MRDSHKLAGIVVAAMGVRAVTLWAARPEFTGWFNHTYYYFVQVRGLLEGGGLPYPDMPLLFAIDAAIARGLEALGLSLESAVVAATRLSMCVTPALVPVPIYGVVRSINRGRSLESGQWIPVLSAGFLPLTLSHLPETLQKNMLGLLLLALLVFLSRRLLERRARADAAVVALLVLLTALAHYGTVAAMLLYGLALVLAVATVGGAVRRALVPATALSLVAAVSVAVIYLFDARRFHRLFEYLAESARGSIVGALLGAGDVRSGLLGSAAAVLAFYALLAVLAASYRRHAPRLAMPDRIFWAANIAFSGLLLLPILDERLMGRLALFASLPLLIVLIHLERHGLARVWARRLVLGGVGLAVLLLSVGELVSSRVHNADHAEVLADLEELQARDLFGPGDLVIAPTGAEHICNWFFGVDAGVVTALELDDFSRYRRIYVLNPIEGELRFEGIAGRRAVSERDRYLFMRRNIPRPRNVEPLFSTDHVEVFALERPPAEWEFGTDGRWMSYSRSVATSTVRARSEDEGAV